MRERNSSHQKLIIEFHPSFILVALGFILTGHYLNLITFTTLIIIHELGHYAIARINHFKVKKIVIYPYGGITKLDSLINRDINEELQVATAGIIWQYAFYQFITILYHLGIIRTYTMNLYTLYNTQMIFFNLLPIYPLDGSKILTLLLEKYLPYQLSNQITISLSLITIGLLIALNTYQYNYSNIMIFVILLTYLYQFYQKRKYLYHKFLLERYLYNIKYSKTKKITNQNQMYKNKTHLFYRNHHYETEKDFLNHYFQPKLHKNK